ncbi:MAG: thiamine phosphate synthase [Alphaproteobacteria bacterium]
MYTPSCRLYLISPPRLDDVEGFARVLTEALDAGDVACFQLRLKDVDEATVAEAARRLRPLVQEREVAFLLNDRPDLARKLGCDGVHVGQEDASCDQARRSLGPDATIGVTCHASRHLAIQASEQGADYVAFGAFYPTETKKAKVRAPFDILAWWREIGDVPSVAIGGITVENALPLVKAGADFLAVSAGIWTHPQGPAAAVAAFNEIMTTGGRWARRQPRVVRPWTRGDGSIPPSAESGREGKRRDNGFTAHERKGPPSRGR